MWSKDFRSPVNPWNKIPADIHTFGIFSRVQPFFSDPLAKRGGEGGGSVCKSHVRWVVPWSGDGQRQCTPSPWKNFHRSLTPLPSSYRCYLSLPPLPPDTTTPRREKTDTSRRKSESYFPGFFFSKPFLLSLLSSSSSSSYLASPAYQKCKRTRGDEEGLDSLCGVGGSRVARMADVSWESCFRNAARIVSHPWNGGRGVEWKRKRGDTMPYKPVHRLLRVELVCSIECVLYLLKRIWGIWSEDFWIFK